MGPPVVNSIVQVCSRIGVVTKGGNSEIEIIPKLPSEIIVRGHPDIAPGLGYGILIRLPSVPIIDKRRYLRGCEALRSATARSKPIQHEHDPLAVPPHVIVPRSSTAWARGAECQSVRDDLTTRPRCYRTSHGKAGKGHVVIVERTWVWCVQSRVARARDPRLRGRHPRGGPEQSWVTCRNIKPVDRVCSRRGEDSYGRGSRLGRIRGTRRYDRDHSW